MVIGGNVTDGTGAPFPRDGVTGARAGLEKFRAYEKVVGETYLSRTGRKAISCRWYDINMGDQKSGWKCVVFDRARDHTERYPQLLCRHSTSGFRPVRDQQRSNENTNWEETTSAVPGCNTSILSADALTETYVNPPHFRSIERCCAESWWRHGFAQLK